MAHKPESDPRAGNGPIRPPESAAEVTDELVEETAESAAASGTPGTAVPWRASSLWHFLLRPRTRGIWIILATLGPGLIAANAGNDAGAVATFASVGSTYGYSLLWVLPLLTISLAVVQEMAARMGAATGKGLSDLIRENFSLHTTAFVMLGLLVSNAATVISEFVGIKASVGLVASGHVWVEYLAVPLIALIIWLLVVRGSYGSVERVLLAMTLVFFAYPITAFKIHPDWGGILRQTVEPSFHFTQGYILIFVAVVGTTITPYMQVYVQSAVAEKGITARDYQPERIGVYVGSLFAMLTVAFITIVTAATLFVHHHPVQLASDAAAALRPIAGRYAEILFATGLFGASVLAAAVLPLATAYSVSEALGVEKGVSAGFREAPVFMGLFTGLIMLGVVIALITPERLIFPIIIQIQAIDGILLPIVLFSILSLVNNRRLMGNMTNGPVYNVIAGATAVIVSGLSVVFLVTTVLGWFGVNV